MGKTSAYIISLFLLMSGFTRVLGQDTVKIEIPDTAVIPLKIKIGIEVSGPAIYYSDKNILNTEGYISLDLDEKKSVSLAIGHLNYKYSQYNYSYQSSGSFLRAGMDFNLLKPDKSQGKYWFGIGLHYGLSSYKSETPSFYKTDYWGTTASSIPSSTGWAHFFEFAPGVRTEIFKNFSMGWTVNMRLLLHTSTGRDLKPIYLPGFGNATKKITAGLSYFLVWNIPYKIKNVILRKELPEEEEDTDTENGINSDQGINGSQGPTIR